MTSNTDTYRQARDLLQGLSRDYEKAVTEFAWPDFGSSFNWAVDWFDAIARGVDRPALWIVEEDGSEAKYSFDAMARRSDQVAAHLAANGVARGDRVLLMLNNQVELWDAMLAVMKLGAVILPTTTALGPAELVDRIDRGQARHVIVNDVDAAKFDDVPGGYTRFVIGDVPSGGVAFGDAYDRDVPPSPHPGTAPTDPQLLYFTSGTTSRPKLVEHTQVSYRWATWPPRSGSPRSPGTCTSTSPRPAGPSTRGAVSSPRGSPRRRSSSTTTPGSTPRRCWSRSGGPG